MQARRRAQPSGTNSPSSSHPRLKHRARCVIFFRARHAAARVAPDRGPGRLHREAAGERPPRARPQRRGSPGPIPNPAVKPAFAESTAARGCGRAGRRARGGRFSMAPREARRGIAPAGLLRFGEVAASRVALRAMPAGLCVVRPRHGSRARPQGALRAVTLAESICVLETLMPSKM